MHYITVAWCATISGYLFQTHCVAIAGVSSSVILTSIALSCLREFQHYPKPFTLNCSQTTLCVGSTVLMNPTEWHRDINVDLWPWEMSLGLFLNARAMTGQVVFHSGAII